MDESITLNTFPSSSTEALALLYVQNQNLSKITPTELLELYWKTYYEILNESKERRRKGWFRTLAK